MTVVSKGCNNAQDQKAKSIARLKALSLANALPHAWLFVSDSIDTTLKIATDFSQWLLCQNKQDALACGSCKSCNLFLAHTHPDFHKVWPADKSTISIDSVRAVVEYVGFKPQLGNYKIILIYPAEAMPKQAANALLKSLEEPRGDTIYVLLTKHQDLLLKTIISRCQILRFTDQQINIDPDQTITKQITEDLVKLWLTKSMTAIQIVELWVKKWPDEVLCSLEMVVTDLIRFKYTQDRSLAKIWSEDQIMLSNKLTASKFWAILERLRLAQYWLGNNQKPNLQLLLEDMLLV